MVFLVSPDDKGRMVWYKEGGSKCRTIIGQEGLLRRIQQYCGTAQSCTCTEEGLSPVCTKLRTAVVTYLCVLCTKERLSPVYTKLRTAVVLPWLLLLVYDIPFSFFDGHFFYFYFFPLFSRLRALLNRSIIGAFRFFFKQPLLLQSI